MLARFGAALVACSVACGAPARPTITLATRAPAATPAKPSVVPGRELARYDSIDAFCSPIAAEDATPSNDACEHEHGSCEASPARNVAPMRASILRWNHGSSRDRHEDVAIETARGVFLTNLDLTTADCDPEEVGPPNGALAVALDRGELVVTYDAYERHVRVSPDSPPSRKQTCTVRCDARSDRPRCTAPECGDWSDVP